VHDFVKENIFYS